MTPKVDPQELFDLAEDLKGCLHRHPDVIKAEPDITKDIVSARDKAEAKWRRVVERSKPVAPHK